MSHPFYPFVENEGKPQPKMKTSTENQTQISDVNEVRYAARVAVYDDPAVTPRVEVIEPAPVRDYLESITSTVYRLAREQGGEIPFSVIREIVENLIHAYFIEPTVSILDNGNTIRFSDQGPGIAQKEKALEYGATSATDDMKRYIRGVGSGLPNVNQYMADKGGTLTIEDNLHSGTIVTLSLTRKEKDNVSETQTIQAQVPDTRVQTTPNQISYIPVQLSNVIQKDMSSFDLLGTREQIALSYLGIHESVGPVELVRQYGGSQATWHRELKKLDERGLIEKRGQKRYLTKKGISLLSTIG